MKLTPLAAFASGLLLLLLVPAPALAQGSARISINAGQQATSTSFQQTASFQDFLEQATVTADHQIDAAIFYDVGVTAQVAGGFAAGVAVSFFSQDDAVNVQAALPHPFFFNQTRTVSGTPTGLERSETGVHVLLGWLVPATDRVEIMLTGGPSFFQAEQDVIDRVNYTHAYPYDEAQFSGVATTRLSESAVGFNAGADVAFKFSRNVGVGLLIRYSRGTVDSSLASGTPVSFDVGGLHAGGGLRIIF